MEQRFNPSLIIKEKNLMHILHVVGARPNFMKVGPVMAALSPCPGFRQTLVHTGQHYDANMSEVFFHQLQIPAPDINLEVGSGSHAQQTSQIMSRLEGVVLDRKPNLVLVYGDVNSTVATALVCAKLGIPTGHVEAGLRSFDRTMPEEINRLITDQISDLLFTPSLDGNENLIREGVSKEKIYFVGNVMIDTLVRLLAKADNRILRELLPHSPELTPGKDANLTGCNFAPYALITLHRPSNVDHPEILAKLLSTLNEISQKLLVIFPIHPRTRQHLHKLNIKINNSQMKLIEPVGYLQFLALQQKATVIITDSGGIQEEATFLGVPCLTVRENTERPITIEMGTNTLVGQDMELLRTEVNKITDGKKRAYSIPQLWDGMASERIATVIKSFLN